MDVSNLLSHDTPREIRSQQTNQASLQQETPRLHQYPTRQAISNTILPATSQGLTTPSTTHSSDNNARGAHMKADQSPPSPTPKNVAFELLFEGANNYRARLPMRVQIFPHDTTDSIVTTVKNFYGLYEGAAKGVSFEDDQQNTLIARYENFKNNMVVYVRVIPDYSQSQQTDVQIPRHPHSPTIGHRIPHLDEPLQMLPPQHSQQPMNGQPPSRPQSRVARKRSLSPLNSRDGRSVSAQKTRSRSGMKSREPSVHGSAEDPNSDVINGYSSSDGGAGSVSGSRKARSEQLASSEISATNILEGGRRKRAKFESSELPLFVPPQVPAPSSISSISPQRRSTGQENPSPFPRPVQRTFGYNQPLRSPQNNSYNENSYGILPPGGTSYSTPSAQHSHRLRDRVSVPQISTRASSRAVPRGQGFGILPTPDPTIASCISDEDVALQLMRLGDASNFSHGRTSASTMDDALSNHANVASSATSESGDDSETTEQPALSTTVNHIKLEASPTRLSGLLRKHHHVRDNASGLESIDKGVDETDGEFLYSDKQDGAIKNDPDDMLNEFGTGGKAQVPILKPTSSAAQKPRVNGPKKSSKPLKPRSAGVSKKTKPSSFSTDFKTPLSPASLTPQSRKVSSASTLNFQHQLGADEEDLSSKPRCQRCRKSKKGCDRQRPCQRCQDAGIGAEGCISEDEGNGRKGRFGRHMGVSVKKDNQDFATRNGLENSGAVVDGTIVNSEKSKKRKR